MTVPAGGVRGGEIFFVRRTAGTLVSPISSILSFTNLPDAAANAAAANNNNIFINETTPLVMARPPQHPWKASLWDSCCCRQGGLGPACRALCCPQLLAARVMVRLRLNWLGVPDYASHNKRRTLGIVAAMVGVFWVVLVVTVVPRLLLFLEEGDEDVSSVEDETEQNQLRSGTTLVGRLCWVILIMFGVYTLYILTKLRHFVRRKYQIAPIKCCCCCRSSISSSRRSSCSDCCAPEDCCVSLWCSCCDKPRRRAAPPPPQNAVAVLRTTASRVTKTARPPKSAAGATIRHHWRSQNLHRRTKRTTEIYVDEGRARGLFHQVFK